MKALIISDGKVGHLNQSIALCKHKTWSHEIVEVSYKTKWHKALSYLLDWLGIYTEQIFTANHAYAEGINVVVSTGSTTYYPSKVLSKKLRAKSIAIMLPKGYRLDFDFILAQSHDNPPKKQNIIELPINMALPSTDCDEEEMRKRFKFSKDEHYIGVVIGGPNQVFSMSIQELKPLFDFLLSLDDIEIVVTTSRRTPPEIEEWLKGLPIRFLLLYSEDKFNPIPSFLHHCKNIIITSDSTSMISEAVISGGTSVEILMLRSHKESKFHKLIHTLEGLGVLHIFDANLESKNEKIDLSHHLERIVI